METLIITKAQLMEAVQQHVLDKWHRARLKPVRSQAPIEYVVGTLSASEIIQYLSDFIEKYPHQS